MLSTKHFRFSSLAVLALASFVAVGCGKDKSLDEYQQQKSNEEFAKAQKQTATYGGELVAPVGGQSSAVGVVVSFYATMDPVQNGDNSGQNSRANLRGTVTIYNNGSESTGVINTASFLKAPDQDDDTVGTINAQVTVQLSSSSGTTSTATFTLNGTRNKDQFNGEIAPSDRAGVKATFTTVKDGPAFRGQGSILPTPGRTLRYSGLNEDPVNRGSSIQYIMTLNTGTPSAGYDFVNLFANEKVFNVHLEVDGITVPLPPVNYERDGSLKFQGTVNVGSIPTQINFDCSPYGQGYHCLYNNAQRAVQYEFTVLPGAGDPGPVLPPIHHAPPPSPMPDPVHRPHR